MIIHNDQFRHDLSNDCFNYKIPYTTSRNILTIEPTKLKKLSNICFIQVPNNQKTQIQQHRKGQFEAAQKKKRYLALGALGVWEYGPTFFTTPYSLSSPALAGLS